MERKNPSTDSGHNESLYAMRHSLAHIMAAAIQRLWPETKFGVGPVVEGGFYYDVGLDRTLSPDDLETIERKMREIIAEKLLFERREEKIDSAIDRYKKAGQTHKVELLQDLKAHGTTDLRDIGKNELGITRDDKITTVSFYKLGKFDDLCRGPHLKNSGEAGAFKLTKVSGAYWRGDEKNPMLQRVYGVAFATQTELDKYLKRLEEAEKRDHRKLGKELDIFMTSELVGAGLPLFTHRGTEMISAMMALARELNQSGPYHEVRTGYLTRQELYAKSGHLDKFKDDLFVVKAQDELALKPMNCPHHIQLYARKQRSYRDLPVRYAEFSTLHRNEVKGVLGGLTRVRALTQDDGHAFVRPDQVEGEVRLILGQIDRLMKTYGLKYRVRLSLRDPKTPGYYLGDEKTWQQVESQMESLAKKFKLDYEKAEGEAVFYGPKMDFMATDAIGREWQVSTVQLDFNQPERFDLAYIDEKGKQQRPVMIHRALNGTFERMLGILIEHYAGHFPLWLAPEQIRLVTVNDSAKLAAFAQRLGAELEMSGLRVGLDTANESVGKKVRDAEVMKVPYVAVLGQKELAGDKLAIRAHGGETKPLSLKNLIERLTEEVKTRLPKSLL